jgi:hypothetical protein
MKAARSTLPLVVSLAIVLSAGCVKRDPFLAMQRTDPGPLVEIIEERGNVSSGGITGKLGMDFRDANRHFRGDGYVFLTPAGKIRLEIPGLFGSTVLLMVSDETGTTVYYPSDAIAYHTSSREGGIGPLLPFPMPLSPSTLAEILTGTVSPLDGSTRAIAYEGSSGQKLLTFSDSSGRYYRYLFLNGPTPVLSELAVTLESGELTVSFSPGRVQFTESFSYHNGEIRMKGSLKQVKFTDKTWKDSTGRSPFSIELPPGVTLRELEKIR